MGIADLHIHTTYSWDGLSDVRAVLKQAAHHCFLDVIAITDHDEIRGALEALEYAPQYGIEVVPGIEVSTREGHLLVLFVTQSVPANLSLLETLQCVANLGGIAIAAHPMMRNEYSLSAESIHRAVAHPEARQILVGIETYNGGLVFNQSNKAARLLARKLDLSAVGNSDAHLVSMIANGITAFEGKTCQDLRRALIAGKTRAIRQREFGLRGFLMRWLPAYLLRRAGWVLSNPIPAAPLRFIRETARVC